jgi:hypothetical protein
MEKKAETRRDFIKASVAAATGLAALPLLSQEKRMKVATTQVRQKEYMAKTDALLKSKKLNRGDLDKLMKIAIGSLKGAKKEFSVAYQKTRKAGTFKGLTHKDLSEIAEHGYGALTGQAQIASGGCGSCASCCCCCCPCCCCS